MTTTVERMTGARAWLVQRQEEQHEEGHSWWRVMCLTGVDYFSTLGYQPGIAALAAGALSPLATIVLVALTLFGALPVYRRVAEESPHGEGSIAMLERLMGFWKGKIFVLVLLGFAATDFIITMTLSAADASAHLVENPNLSTVLEGQELWLTLGLLAMLGGVFLRGFSEAIGRRGRMVAVYLALNLVVIGVGLWHIATHPTVVTDWTTALTTQHGDPLMMIALALLVFPKLALGMSGFETGVAVMSHVRGGHRLDDGADHPARRPADDGRRRAAGLPEAGARHVRLRDRRRGDVARPWRRQRHRGRPRGRIRDTKRLLTTAALIMSFFLVTSSIVTTLLIPAPAFEDGGAANGRALAYLAHDYLGNAFGTTYDISTIAILWFAGASAMAGLLNLIPRYLPRYGMAPDWARAVRPLVLVLTGTAFLITWIFDADVDAQGGAYATGVLVLFTSASVAVTLAAHRAGQRKGTVAFALITAVFVYTTVDNVIERPDGIKIGACFIAAIMAVSLASRLRRSFELRATTIELDATSQIFVRDCARRTIRLVANEAGDRDPEEYADKIRQIRRDHDLPHDPDVIFVEVTVTDPSDFEHRTRRARRGAARRVPRAHHRVLVGAQRPGRAAAAHPRRLRGHPAHLLRVDRGQPGDPVPAVPDVRLRGGGPGDPRGAPPRGAGPCAATARACRMMEG